MRTLLMAMVVGLLILPSADQTLKPISDWLVCGPFLFERGLQQFLTDYLFEYGGEANIQPKEGLEHSVIGLGKVTWKRYHTPNGILDFVTLMAKQVGEERPKFWRLRYGLAYAYTEITSDRPQRALLLLGSEDWLAVWFNYSFARSENTGKSWDFVLLSIKAWLQKYPSNSTQTSSHYICPSIKVLLVKLVGHGLFPMPTCRALSHADFLSAQDRACALQLDA